jgi:hypothetical protein
MRRGKPTGDGSMGANIRIQHLEAGGTSAFRILWSTPLAPHMLARISRGDRIRVWASDRLVFDVDLDGDDHNHVIRAWDCGTWLDFLLPALALQMEREHSEREHSPGHRVH